MKGIKRARAWALAMVAAVLLLAPPQPAASGGDDFAADAAPVSLVEAVVAALTENPRLRAAQSGLERSAAGLQETEAGFRSQWGLQLTGSRARIPEPELPFDPDAPEFADQQTAALSWSRPLWSSPRVRAAVEGAGAELAAAHAEWEATRSEVILQTAEAFLDLLQAQEGAEVAAQREAWQAERLRIAQDRWEEGAASRADVLEAESDWREAMADLDHARRGVDLTGKQLRLWMGHTVEPPLRAVDPLEVEDPVLAQALADIADLLREDADGELLVDVERAVERARERRPEMQAAQWGVRASRSGQEAVAAEGKSSITLLGNYRWTDAELTMHLDRWGQFRATLEREWQQLDGEEQPVRDAEDWSVALQVDWTLGDAGVQAGREAQAEAGIEEAQWSLTELQAGLELEVEAAINQLHRARWTEEVAASRLRAAAEALDRAERLQEAEAAASVDVLAARIGLAAAELQVRTARWERAAAELAVALSMGWRPEPPEEVDLEGEPPW